MTVFYICICFGHHMCRCKLCNTEIFPGFRHSKYILIIFLISNNKILLNSSSTANCDIVFPIILVICVNKDRYTHTLFEIERFTISHLWRWCDTMSHITHIIFRRMAYSASRLNHRQILDHVWKQHACSSAFNLFTWLFTWYLKISPDHYSSDISIHFAFKLFASCVGNGYSI